MALDDFSSPGLVLGLGFPSSTAAAVAADNNKFVTKIRPKETNPTTMTTVSFEPSLTLSLISGDFYDDDDDKIAKKVEEINNFNKNLNDNSVVVHDLLYRQDSAASSFSNVSVKREREICTTGSEELEVERVISSSRVSDEDDDGSNGRKKLRLTKSQSALLEESFKLHSTLNPVPFCHFTIYYYFSQNYLIIYILYFYARIISTIFYILSSSGFKKKNLIMIQTNLNACNLSLKEYFSCVNF